MIAWFIKKIIKAWGLRLENNLRLYGLKQNEAEPQGADHTESSPQVQLETEKI